MTKQTRERWMLIGIGAILGILISNIGIAQEGQENGEASSELAFERIKQMELKVLEDRQKKEADRRREVGSLTAAAELLTAETQMFSALAQNCLERKTAYEAGAAVDLCERDKESAVRSAETDVAAALLAAQNELSKQLEDRVAELEREVETKSNSPTVGAPASTVVIPAVIPAAPPPPPEKKRWVVLLDVSQAVVREEGRGDDMVFLMPLEAFADGSECIRTRVKRDEIKKGTRICLSGQAMPIWRVAG